MKRLPIKVAKDVSRLFGLDQVCVIAWDGTRSHVVTYGKNGEQCRQAALLGDKIKTMLGWPDVEKHPTINPDKCRHHLCRPSSKKKGHRECCVCGKLVEVPIKVKVRKCKACGYPISEDQPEEFCGECMCEDDCAP